MCLYLFTAEAACIHSVSVRCQVSAKEENMNEGSVLFNDALKTFYLWRQTYYGKRTIQIAREETRCHHIGYSVRIAAMVLLYAPSHRQDSTYHGLCYISRGALDGTRNSSMGKTLFSVNVRFAPCLDLVPGCEPSTYHPSD